MTRKYITAIAISCGLLIGGCAHYSTSGLRHEPVLVDRTTTKTVGEIVGCLDAAWNRQGAVSFVPNAHGGTVSLTPPGLFVSPILFLVDIDDLGASRHVSFRMTKVVWSKQITHQRTIVEGCA